MTDKKPTLTEAATAAVDRLIGLGQDDLLRDLRTALGAEAERQDVMENLRIVARTAAHSIDDYLTGEWDGNSEGWRSVADHLLTALARCREVGL